LTQAACGTYLGYLRHRRGQEPACTPCLRAHAEYDGARLDRKPGARAEKYARLAARSRARVRLKHEYPDRYEALREEQLRLRRPSRAARARAEVQLAHEVPDRFRELLYEEYRRGDVSAT
jgi:hypothetical protein